MGRRILTIQDFSSVGRCSLTAALPILTACGHDTVGLPTAFLSTQTYGIKGYTFRDLSSDILPAYGHWKSLNIKFDCLYTGFLGSMEAVEATISIARELKTQGAYIAVDPAMAENGKMYGMFDSAYKDKIFELCRIADIVMPNFTEGKMLADLGMKLEPNEENAGMILNILKHNGYKTVLLSGIYKDSQLGTALLNDKKITFQTNTAFNEFIHGAGDCLSSVFIGKFMAGNSAERSAQAAVNFCKDCIEMSLAEKVDLRFGLLIENAVPNMKFY